MIGDAVALPQHIHARVSPEFRVLGRDVAVTADRPLLETDAWFGPPLHTSHVMTEVNWRRILG